MYIHCNGSKEVQVIATLTPVTVRPGTSMRKAEPDPYDKYRRSTCSGLVALTLFSYPCFISHSATVLLGFTHLHKTSLRSHTSCRKTVSTSSSVCIQPLHLRVFSSNVTQRHLVGLVFHLAHDFRAGFCYALKECIEEGGCVVRGKGAEASLGGAQPAQIGGRGWLEVIFITHSLSDGGR